jgi:hypothetical protein
MTTILKSNILKINQTDHLIVHEIVVKNPGT